MKSITVAISIRQSPSEEVSTRLKNWIINGDWTIVTDVTLSWLFFTDIAFIHTAIKAIKFMQDIYENINLLFSINYEEKMSYNLLINTYSLPWGTTMWESLNHAVWIEGSSLYVSSEKSLCKHRGIAICMKIPDFKILFLCIYKRRYISYIQYIYVCRYNILYIWNVNLFTRRETDIDE